MCRCVIARSPILDRAGLGFYRGAMYSCARCSTPASTLMTFAYGDSAVWLEDLESDPADMGGYALCTAHADRLSPPLGWTLTDRRNVTRLFAPEAPSEVA